MSNEKAKQALVALVPRSGGDYADRPTLRAFGHDPASGGSALHPDRDAYLDEASFCRRYWVKPRTAQRWRVSGEGPRYMRAGPRRITYRLTDCEEWAARRTFAHRADEISSANT